MTVYRLTGFTLLCMIVGMFGCMGMAVAGGKACDGREGSW